MTRKFISITMILVVAMLVLAGCRESQAGIPGDGESINIEATFTPEVPAVGDATMLVTLTDTDGEAITNASVTIHADMNHAGMVPVIETVEDNEDGVYTIPFEWTMGGDWIVTVTATFPNGDTYSQDFEVMGVAGEADMDMGGMDDMDMEATEEADMDMDMDAEMTPEATEAADMDMDDDEDVVDPAATEEAEGDNNG